MRPFKHLVAFSDTRLARRCVQPPTLTIFFSALKTLVYRFKGAEVFLRRILVTFSFVYTGPVLITSRSLLNPPQQVRSIPVWTPISQGRTTLRSVKRPPSSTGAGSPSCPSTVATLAHPADFYLRWAHGGT